MPHHHSHEPSEKTNVGRLVFRVVLAVIIVGLLVAYSMSFQVSEGYQTVVTRFGEPVRSVHKTGLFFKWPWPIEQAHAIDVRRRLFNTPYSATFTGDDINVVLLTYVVWRVEDPLLFLQSLGTRKAAELKLESLVAAEKNRQLGGYKLSALVSMNPGDIKTDQIEEAILKDVAADARRDFGIVVEQVGIKRIAYPEENMASVLENMRREREAVAKNFRAEGLREASRILSEAEAASAETIKEGDAEAGQIRGEAEKKVAAILSEAAQLDPEFYGFWRSLRALKTTLGAKATVILRTDQSIFEPLTKPPKPPETAATRSQTPQVAEPGTTLSAAESKGTP